VIAKRLHFETTHATEFVDVTARLRDEVRRAGLRFGRVHLQSLHTTLGLAVNENEPLLLQDFQNLLEKLPPAARVMNTTISLGERKSRSMSPSTATHTAGSCY
jgi:thiamine phosphate synthase YjbQ (UPF0047 family)